MRRFTILNLLRKPRLIQVARALGLPAPKNAIRKTLVGILEKSRAFTTRDLLELLHCDELKAACDALGWQPNGANKAAFIARLTGDSSVLLRSNVVASLRSQGFAIRAGRIYIPEGIDKDRIRRLHECAMKHKRDRAKAILGRYESDLLGRIANGSELRVESIFPKLVEVTRGSDEELLFRYACLHWTIPVSSGYGRRLRFLIVDGNNNDRLIGVLGLGDPVFALQPRESWIGWNSATRSARLQNIVDAFVLGAAPPYSQLLCGKLVAMLAASNEVRVAFKKKYAGKETLISGKKMDGDIALLTTTSALGRSSVYNRITFRNATLYQSIGYTQGYGDFQFLNGLYDELSAFAHSHCEATAKNNSWGTGFRNRREVVKKSLKALGLSSELLCHGVRREVFVVPTATNSKSFLCGETDRLDHTDRPAEELWTHFRNRWLLPRAARDQRFRTFKREEYRLWAAVANNA
ncbi:MAG: DUF4338 domain-containing protein [Pirellulales bacterium]|nr:DUF4338 domain-containing protein [Pirellulales bacterium]